LVGLKNELVCFRKLNSKKTIHSLLNASIMAKGKVLKIEDYSISIVIENNEDYISLTDMAKSQMEDIIIIKWLSLKNTIEYIGEWEAMYNPIFNYTEFGKIKR
jgi:hypothetical protein